MAIVYAKWQFSSLRISKTPLTKLDDWNYLLKVYPTMQNLISVRQTCVSEKLELRSYLLTNLNTQWFTQCEIAIRYAFLELEHTRQSSF